jgi:hypothetical protein
MQDHMFDWKLLGNSDVTLYFGIGDITDEDQVDFIVNTLNRKDLFEKGKLITFSIVYELLPDEQEMDLFRAEVNKIHKKLSVKRRKLFVPNVVHEKIKDKTKFLEVFSTRLRSELTKPNTFTCPDTLQ